MLKIVLLAGVLVRLSEAAEGPNPPIKDLGNGAWQVGAVTLDKSAKTLTFAAEVNMTNGLVEYALVTRTGKVHESLLRTDVEPVHLHTAMLLLGAKVVHPAVEAFSDLKQEIPGSKIAVEIMTLGPQSKTRPVQEFLTNTQTEKAAAIPYWIYNGSRVSNGVFLAQSEGSILSLIADASALANNPRDDRENDELWTLDSAEIPPVGTPVRVKFTLLDAPVSK